jgi:predicted CoA-substrate-specific enzyme activase
MYVAGIDLGSATGKVVILKDGEIASWAVTKATAKPEKTAHTAMAEAIEKAGLSSIEDLSYITGTGYGRTGVSFIQDNLSEISCHAKGASWLHPQARTIIDIGGQDSKVISVSKTGKVMDFSMNDKCAAGTGKFFEAMARTLDCSLDEFSEYALQAKNPCTISKQCSVFAESEVITLINNDVDITDISGGLIDSIVRRLLSMVLKVGVADDIVLTGGCAKNLALQKGLEKILNNKVVALDENPQIVGALGAALFALEKLELQEA